MTTQLTNKHQMTAVLLIIAALTSLVIFDIYDQARHGLPVVAVVETVCFLVLILPSIYRRPNLKDAFLLAVKGVKIELDENMKQTTHKWRMRSFTLVAILQFALSVYLLFLHPLGGFFAFIAVYAIVMAQREQGDAFWANIIDIIKKAWHECKGDFKTL